jgi:hypothetical protein
MLTNQAIEGLVSARRLKAFLDSDELQPDAREIRLNPNPVDGDVVCCGVKLYGNKSGNSFSGVGNQGWRIQLV